MKFVDNLRKTAYWFYMAQKWNVPEAVAAQEEYQLLIRDLAIVIAKYSTLNKGTSVGTVIAVIAGIIVALLLAGGIAALTESRLDLGGASKGRTGSQRNGSQPICRLRLDNVQRRWNLQLGRGEICRFGQ